MEGKVMRIGGKMQGGLRHKEVAAGGRDTPLLIEGNDSPAVRRAPIVDSRRHLGNEKPSPLPLSQRERGKKG